MALPTKQRTWIIDPNNRIPYVSLLGTLSAFFYEIKEFLKANGYTVVGSSNGTTGAMDAVDRWGSPASIATRGTSTTVPQSWFVFLDGNGAQILLTYQGASDDIAKVSVSPGALWIVAGTPTHQPTATDEIVVNSAASLIGSTASADRVWHGWVNSTAKLCRFAVARQGALTGRMWGVEEYSSSMVVPATPNPVGVPIWGFSIDPTQTTLTSGLSAGGARLFVAAVPFAVTAFVGFEGFPPGGASAPLTFLSSTKAELQGATGYLLLPMGIGSNTTGARGKIANLYDHWMGRASGGALGQTYGVHQFIALLMNNQTFHYVWPWDGVTTPVVF